MDDHRVDEKQTDKFYQYKGASFFQGIWFSLFVVVATSGMGLFFAVFAVFENPVIPQPSNGSAQQTIQLPLEFTTSNQPSPQVSSEVPSKGTGEPEVMPIAFFVEEQQPSAEQQNQAIRLSGGTQTVRSKPVRLSGFIEPIADTPSE